MLLCRANPFQKFLEPSRSKIEIIVTEDTYFFQISLILFSSNNHQFVGHRFVAIPQSQIYTMLTEFRITRNRRIFFVQRL